MMERIPRTTLGDCGYEALKAKPSKSILQKPGIDIPSQPSIEKPLEPSMKKEEVDTLPPSPVKMLHSSIQKRLFDIESPGSTRKLRSILKNREAEEILAQEQLRKRKAMVAPNISPLRRVKKRKSGETIAQEPRDWEKRRFNPPTLSPLPLVIKIHDPIDREEDDKYLKSLVPPTTASPSGWDQSSPVVQPSELQHNVEDQAFEDTIVIIRVRPSTSDYRIPEVVGVYPKTAEGFAEVERCIRQPIADWKIYENGEVDTNDASMITFGSEPDGSKVYVYKKSLQRSNTSAAQHQKEVFVVNRTYYNENHEPKEGDVYERNDILGVFDTLAEANEAAPKLLEKDYEGRLLEEGVEGEAWEEYEEEMLDNGSVCINSEGRVGEFFHVMVGKQMRCEATGKRTAVVW